MISFPGGAADFELCGTALLVIGFESGVDNLALIEGDSDNVDTLELNPDCGFDPIWSPLLLWAIEDEEGDGVAAVVAAVLVVGFLKKENRLCCCPLGG